MSYEADHAYVHYEEKKVSMARTPHTCDACQDIIPRLHSYWRIVVIDEGDLTLVKRCLRCQAIHLHLRTLGGNDMWPSEKLDCELNYEEHWGKEPPPEILALAFLSAADTP